MCAVARSNRLPGGFIGVIAVLLSVGSSVFGQFVVSPMKLDNIQLESNKRMTRSISIENQTDKIIDQVDLAIVDVMQDPNGAVTPLATGDPNVDRSKLRSCASWINLDRTTMRLAPWQKDTFNLQVRVPSRMQGYYCAAITAKATFPAGAVAGYSTGVAIVYVIPIIIDVRGRPLRNEVELVESDVGLRFAPASPASPAASIATLGVDNKGGTFCRLQGYLRISNLWGGHWRRITETQYADIGIMPGAKLLLKRDVGRPLPAGKYKLEGFLIVNGTRADQIQREIEFAGDPRVAVQHSDAALDFDPRELIIDAVPASLRVSRIQVVNASEEPVDVSVELALPEYLKAVVGHDPNDPSRAIPGEEFGCSSWITVQPSQFHLDGYGRQNLSVRADVPEKATGLPDYYSVINLKVRFPDGQAAGTATGRICLQMKRMVGTPKLHTSTIQVSLLAPTKYMVLARTCNTGTTHILPSCRGVVVTRDGTVQRRIEMSSEIYNQVGNLLPLENRNFSGVLDVAGLAPGQYYLIIVLEGEKVPAEQSQNGLLISETNGAKSVQVVGLEAVGGTITGNF